MISWPWVQRLACKKSNRARWPRGTRSRWRGGRGSRPTSGRSGGLPFSVNLFFATHVQAGARSQPSRSSLLFQPLPYSFAVLTLQLPRRFHPQTWPLRIQRQRTRSPAWRTRRRIISTGELSGCTTASTTSVADRRTCADHWPRAAVTTTTVRHSRP